VPTVPVFQYSASDATARWSRGTILADTPRVARDLLRQRGLRVHDLSPHHNRRRGTGFSALAVGRWRSVEHKTVPFVRELATLLGVGVPLLEAIDGIARQHAGRFHTVLLELRDRVAAGASLADAMREQSDVFDEFCVNLTEVGENTGSLDTVLERLAEFKERAAALKDRVGTALIYPSVVLIMAVGVSVFLMTVVVPNLLDGLIEAGQPIPRVTQVVKFLSDLMIQRWWVLAGAGAATVAGAAAALRTERGLLLWHRTLLRIPIAGDMARKQAILRIAIVVSTLMRNGIEFVRAVNIARHSTPNRVVRAALARCEDAVNGGQDIAKALEATAVFPPVVVQLFAVGQQAGRLEEMLDRLAVSYDQRLTTASQRLTAVLEPVLILFLVIVVGFIAFATVLPMLEAANVF
jgi:type II secretory pathway component PulF